MFDFFFRRNKPVTSPRSPRHGARSRLGLEALGRGYAPDRGSRHWHVRPELERLEERQVPSSSGVISAVTDIHGQTTAFTVGGNGQVYELNPTVRSGWFPFMSYDPAGFRQVSAGLDGYGRAVCYALHNGDNHIWKMDNYKTVGFTTEAWDSWIQATQISATRNNECYFVEPASTGSIIGVYNGYTNYYTNLVIPWMGCVQISAGLDRFGNDEVYELNGTQNVAVVHNNGTYQWLPMHATQISAGMGRNWTDTDLFYIDTSASHNVYHYDGSSSQLIHYYASQISAGLDRYGNAIVHSIDMYYHWVYKSDLSGNLNGTWEGGGVSQITAAGNGLVFGVSNSDNSSIYVFEPADLTEGAWLSLLGNQQTNSWHFLNGYASNPYYAPFDA
jgi:hypothetical protein